MRLKKIHSCSKLTLFQFMYQFCLKRFNLHKILHVQAERPNLHCSPGIIMLMTSRKMRGGECGRYVGREKYIQSFGGESRKWRIKEIRREGMDLIQLAHNRHEWWSLLKKEWTVGFQEMLGISWLTKLLRKVSVTRIQFSKTLGPRGFRWVSDKNL